MRRVALVLSIVIVALLGVVATQGRPAAVAQEGTPSGDAMAGLTFEPLGYVQGVALPGVVDLTAARTGFEPGAGFPLVPTSTEGVFVAVTSGAITGRVDDAAWTITRGFEAGEEIAPGAEATLEAGDSAFIPGGVTGEVRNGGDVRAEAIVFLLAPASAAPGGTPAP